MRDRDLERSISEIRRELEEFRLGLNKERARIFSTISADLFISVSALLLNSSEQINVGGRGLIASVNQAGFRSYSSARGAEPVARSEHDLAYVIMQLGLSTSETIESFEIPLEAAFTDRLLGSMLSLGRAQGALAALQSPWAKAFASRQDADVLAAIQAGRKAGGALRGARLRERASEWKAEGLPIAIELDRLRPSRNRSGLARAVLARLKTENRPGTEKSVENWLRDEVEPLGLVRSRKRTKSAKLT